MEGLHLPYSPTVFHYGAGMTDENLKARHSKMSANARRLYLKIMKTHKQILALQMLSDTLSVDRILGKLGLRPADRRRAQIKKDKLVEIIRERAGRKSKQN